MTRTRSRPAWVRAIWVLPYVMFCAIALAGGAFAGWLGSSETGSVFIAGILKGRQPHVKDSEVFDGKSEVNLLILGCDVDLSPGGRRVLLKQARSDMMLVAHLDFEKNRITGISIPRDTLVAISGYREQKINGYHAIGARQSAERGRELSKEAVETVLAPVKIDRVLVLDYDAFKEMVDLVGGVTLFVDKNMEYDDDAGNLHIHFKPGRQHMNGLKAMGFVRFRHSDDDYHRQDRQKQFMMAFKDAMLKHLSVLGKLGDKARQALGDGLSAEEVIALAYYAKQVGQDNIKMGNMPVVPAGKYTYYVDNSKLRSVLQEFNFIPKDGAAFAP